MFSKSGIISVALICCGFQSAASIYVESPVKDFIRQASPASTEKLPVLLIFSGASRQSSADQATLSRPQRIREMINQNQENISRLRDQGDWARGLDIQALWIINGALTQLTAKQVESLSKYSGLRAIFFSEKAYRFQPPQVIARSSMPRDLTYGLKKIQIPELWKSFPELRGQGIRVGIIDTGIAPEHPDLKGRLSLFRNFSPADSDQPRDEFGHGTHVAGTIAGGQTSGTAIGVAPQADLIVARIFDGSGNSSRDQILQAMQWMADPDENPDTPDYAQVVNNSWSDDEPFSDRKPEDEPFCMILSSWVQLNMIPVFAAGNSGPSEGTINLPAGCPEAFSVGATEQNDRSPHFSSTGPARWKDLDLMKPEVSAPGFKVLSAENHGRYVEMSGTSMAAPHVTGAFAILLQAFPAASMDQIKQAMLKGSVDLGEPNQDAVFGYGRIDVLRSLESLRATYK